MLFDTSTWSVLLMKTAAVLHLNDAIGPCGCRRDRHAAPGQGTIGEGLRALVAHPMFEPLPAILEVDTASAMQGINYLLGA